MPFFSFLFKPKLSMKDREELRELRRKKYIESEKKKIESEFR